MTEHVTDGDGGSVADGVIAAVEVVGVAEVLTHALDIDEA